MPWTTKAINARKRIGHPGTSEPSFAHHAASGHRILDEMETAGKPIPPKKDLEKLITDDLLKTDQPAFVDASDWRKLWKVLGVSWISQKHVGRSQTTSGKGRNAKGWDV